MKDQYDNMFPISWDESHPCGCISHVTDTGTGYTCRRECCNSHKDDANTENTRLFPFYGGNTMERTDL